MLSVYLHSAIHVTLTSGFIIVNFDVTTCFWYIVAFSPAILDVASGSVRFQTFAIMQTASNRIRRILNIV